VGCVVDLAWVLFRLVIEFKGGLIGVMAVRFDTSVSLSSLLDMSYSGRDVDNNG
jgi:hypothetical protein